MVSSVQIMFSLLAVVHGQYIFFTDLDLRGENPTVSINFRCFFASCSLIIGHFVDEYRHRIAQDTDELDQCRKALDDLSKRFLALRKAKEQLETRFLSEEQTAFSLYEAAKKLERFDIEHLHSGVLELLHQFVRVRKSSLYLLKDNALVLAAHMGWEQDEKKPDMQIDKNDLYLSRWLNGKIPCQFAWILCERNWSTMTFCLYTLSSSLKEKYMAWSV